MKINRGRRLSIGAALAGLVLTAAASAAVVGGGPAAHASAADPGRGPGEFSLFEHDTSQQFLALAPVGSIVGDQFVFGGNVLDHQGGTQVGRMAGSCTNTSASEILCSAAFTIRTGQIVFGGIVDQSRFSSGQPVDFAVTGGTGSYRDARGTITGQLLPNSPNRADAVFTVDLS